MNFLKLTLRFMVICLLTQNAQAWREGNGGDAVKTPKGIFLLDLIEAGIEETTDTSTFLKNSFFHKNLESLEKNIGPNLPIDYLESKLQQIYLKNSILSLAIMQTINTLSWKFVNIPLKDVQDEGPNLSIPRADLIQAAYRINQTVQIHRPTWNKLDSRNQAALMLHEVLYALMIPERDNNGIDMNSPRVRVLIGHFFSADFSDKSIQDYLSSDAPHLNFPKSINPQIEPTQTNNGDSIILNRQWYATIPTQNGSYAFEQIPISSNLVPQWIEYICGRALQEKTSFRFGLQGEKLSCAIKKVGSGSSEEFYILPDYQLPATLSVIEVTKPDGADTTSCNQEVRSKMNWLIFQSMN